MEEHLPYKQGAISSSPITCTILKKINIRGISSVGRTSALQAEGQEFESLMLHHLCVDLIQPVRVPFLQVRSRRFGLYSLHHWYLDIMLTISLFVMRVFLI